MDSVEIEAWRVALQKHGARRVVDVRYAVWQMDGVWHLSQYGISVDLHQMPKLIADLQAIAVAEAP